MSECIEFAGQDDSQAELEADYLAPATLSHAPVFVVVVVALKQ